jgi:carbamoyltransferase
MYVLGIATHVTCGSALIKDGVVVAAVNDERLVRKKMVFGFPRQSIRKVIELADITPSDIDYVAVATKRQHFINHYVDYLGGKFDFKRGKAKEIFFDVGSSMSKWMNTFPILEKIYYLLRQPFFIYRRKKIKNILKNELRIECPVAFIDHHLCHATCAYYSSPFDEATIVTADSAGDGISSQTYKVSCTMFEKLNEVSSYNSPCAFYSYVTHICGFKAGKHEGKITGLAAHGKPHYVDFLRTLIIYEKGSFKNVGGVFFKSGIKAIEDGLKKDIKKEDLAASIQQYSEEMLVNYVKHWVNITGLSNVALAGGIFANVRINQEIHEITGVKSVFIHPGMSDEGIGLGAALALYYEKTKNPKKVCFENVYLGPGYSNIDIEHALKKTGLKYEYHDEIEKKISKLLNDGYVVARFNGRMEYGPRALGNRSILCKATDPSVNDWLNKKLKRTEFMPFAPATIIEDTDKCYIGVDGAKDTARFMTITFRCTDWMKENCAGVVHVDGTARPQLVREIDNPSFYHVINEYKKLTGSGTIINTSFNIHEEPIVCSPQDAIRAFKEGHLHYLAIGNYLVNSIHME